MNNFIYRVIIYLLSFLLSLYALNGLDYSKFIKKNRVQEAWLLYFLIAMALGYLVGSMLINLIYYFAI